MAQQELIERQWPERAKKYQRILVLINLRAAGDERLPATNVVAMIYVDRCPHGWNDRRRMLRILHWELAIVKRLRLGIVFVMILQELQQLFGSIQRLLSPNTCHATSVASKLGPVL